MEDEFELTGQAEEDGGGEARMDVQGQDLANVDRRQSELPPAARPQALPTPKESNSVAQDYAKADIRPTDIISSSGVTRTNYVYGPNGNVQASYQQRLRGAPRPEDNAAPVVNDPQTQQAVKDAENAIQTLQNDQTVRPDQVAPIIKGYQDKINQLDPNHVFRKGGILSRMTSVAKAVADRVHINEQAGIVSTLQPDGKITHDNLPDKESKAHQIKIAELKIEEQKIKNQQAAQDRASRLESLQHERNIKHEQKHGASFDAIFKPTKLDKEGNPQPMSDEEKMDLLAKRRVHQDKAPRGHG